MKYLKRFNQINEGYSFTKKYNKSNVVIYLFKDEFNNSFKTSFTPYINLDDNEYDSSYELDWEVFNKSKRKWTYDIVSTNIYKLLSTILGDILNDFISKNINCDVIAITGHPEKDENGNLIENRRFKVYNRYLTNYPIKGWFKTIDGDDIYLNKI